MVQLADVSSHHVGAVDSPQARGRLPYGDVLRLLAIAAVVGIHCIHHLPKPLQALSPTAAPWAAYALSGATRWCVPVFLMLSGALLIEPRRAETAKEFYRRRLARVLPPLAFWSLFYIAWRWFVLGTFKGPTSIGVALLRGDPEYHLWYAFTLLGLYATVPLLRRVYLPAARDDQWIIALASLGVWAAAATAWIALGYIGWRIPPSSVVFAEWMPYLGYFLMGHLLRDVRLQGRGLLACVAITTAFTLGNTLMLWLLATHGRGYLASGLLGYLSPLVLAQSLGMFLTMSAVIRGGWTESSMIRRLSGATYGVYLAHVFVLNILEMGGLMRDSNMGSASILAIWLLALISTFTLVFALSRIPIVKSLVGTA